MVFSLDFIFFSSLQLSCKSPGLGLAWLTRITVTWFAPTQPGHSCPLKHAFLITPRQTTFSTSVLPLGNCCYLFTCQLSGYMSYSKYNLELVCLTVICKWNGLGAIRSRTTLFDWILAPPLQKKKDSLHSPEHSFRVELKGKFEVSKGHREACKNWRLGVHQNKASLTGFANSKTPTKTLPKHWVGKKKFHVDFSIRAYGKTQTNFLANSKYLKKDKYNGYGDAH